MTTLIALLIAAATAAILLDGHLTRRTHKQTCAASQQAARDAKGAARTAGHMAGIRAFDSQGKSATR